jgi:hypothetical protein
MGQRSVLRWMPDGDTASHQWSETHMVLFAQPKIWPLKIPAALAIAAVHGGFPVATAQTAGPKIEL